MIGRTSDREGVVNQRNYTMAQRNLKTPRLLKKRKRRNPPAEGFAQRAKFGSPLLLLGNSFSPPLFRATASDHEVKESTVSDIDARLMLLWRLVSFIAWPSLCKYYLALIVNIESCIPRSVPRRCDCRRFVLM